MKSISIKRIIALSMTVAVSLCSFAGFSADSSTTTESRTYIKRVLSGDDEGTYQYTLTQELDNNSGVATANFWNGINGTDDRVPDSNQSIVHFNGRNDTQYEVSSLGGTGFIVDDHTIATAAHCVYRKSTNSFSSNIKVDLYSEEGTIERQIYATEIHIPSLYKTSSESECHKFDYALITVNQDLSDYGIFSLGVLTDEAQASADIPITLSGFPSYLMGENGSEIANSNHTLYTGTGYFLDSDDYNFTYDTDSSEGNSGGPAYISMYYTTGNNTVTSNTVVGICHGRKPLEGQTIQDAENIACRITSPILQFYLNNPNIGY